MKSAAEESTVRIHAGPVEIEGDLFIPKNPGGVVLFAHGSGSSRFSPRNRFVAQALHKAGLATLLIDLLTGREEKQDLWNGHFRFDIHLLSRRLVAAVDWLNQCPETHDLAIGCFGASTGSAAALRAAVERPRLVKAVVSRGGRPDLAEKVLSRVEAPTLLIVGGNDAAVIQWNRDALEKIPAKEKKLELVPGATLLFEEPGALQEVARLAGEWFGRYLKPPL